MGAILNCKGHIFAPFFCYVNHHKFFAMKKVLIALDYNRSAEKIAETGYALAKGLGAEVTLIHVIADAAYYSTLEYSPVMGYTGFSSPEMVPLLDMAELKNASKSFLEQSKKHLGDDTIST